MNSKNWVESGCGLYHASITRIARQQRETKENLSSEWPEVEIELASSGMTVHWNLSGVASITLGPNKALV